MTKTPRNPAALAGSAFHHRHAGGGWREAFAGYLRARRALFFAALVLAVGWILCRVHMSAPGPNAAAALTELALERDCLVNRADAEHAIWTEDGVIFLGRQDQGAARDVYFARARRANNGAVLGWMHLVNLSKSPALDEFSLVERHGHAVFLARSEQGVEVVHSFGLEGESPSLTADWPRLARLQNGITNWLDSGRWSGFARKRWTLSPPVASMAPLASKSEAQEGKVAPAGNLCFRVIPSGDKIHDDRDARTTFCLGDVTPSLDKNSEHVRAVPVDDVKVQPDLIAWLVDTIRGLDMVGPAPIEWLEHRVFGAKDLAQRWWFAWFEGDVADDVEQEFAEGLQVGEALTRVHFEAKEQATGLPPAKLQTMLRPALREEGAWIAVESDAFVRRYPGAPPAFYQSFLRTDTERPFSRVYMVLWDTRQIQLHFATGAREPRSASGETGPGMIPRDPHVLKRVVAGFNGGFQALHGEFGVMADRKVYIPPKPWAATVATYDDGRVAMGSWRGAPKRVYQYDPAWAEAQIPKDMVSYRQNLTSVVEDGRYNPWERWWWGAAPHFAKEQTYIDRSGLCLTTPGHLVYFWGQSLGPEALGEAMKRADCVRGMHLDMNLPHTGFEYYHVREASRPFAPLSRALNSAEYEGPVPRAEGLIMRVRKAASSMKPIEFPRYIGRDGRDFFYLTLRPILPGPSVEMSLHGKPSRGESASSRPAPADASGSPPGEHRPTGQGASTEDVLRFSSLALPQPAWPPAFATASMNAGDGCTVSALRVDPRRVDLAPLGDANTENVTDEEGPREAAAAAAALATWGCVSGPSAAASQEENGCEVGARSRSKQAAGRAGQIAIRVCGRGARRVFTAGNAGEDDKRCRDGVDWAFGAPLSPKEARGVVMGVDGDGFLTIVEAEEAAENETKRFWPFGRDKGEQNGACARLMQVAVERLALRGLMHPGRLRLRFMVKDNTKVVSAAGFASPAASFARKADLLPTSSPYSEVLFPDNEPQPYRVWARLQDTRVRYALDGPKRFRRFGAQDEEDEEDESEAGQKDNKQTKKPTNEQQPAPNKENQKSSRPPARRQGP